MRVVAAVCFVAAMCVVVLAQQLPLRTLISIAVTSYGRNFTPLPQADLAASSAGVREGTIEWQFALYIEPEFQIWHNSLLGLEHAASACLHPSPPATIDIPLPVPCLSAVVASISSASACLTISALGISHYLRKSNSSPSHPRLLRRHGLSNES